MKKARGQVPRDEGCPLFSVVPLTGNTTNIASKEAQLRKSHSTHSNYSMPMMISQPRISSDGTQPGSDHLHPDLRVTQHSRTKHSLQVLCFGQGNSIISPVLDAIVPNRNSQPGPTCCWIPCHAIPYQTRASRSGKFEIRYRQIRSEHNVLQTITIWHSCSGPFLFAFAWVERHPGHPARIASLWLLQLTMHRSSYLHSCLFWGEMRNAQHPPNAAVGHARRRKTIAGQIRLWVATRHCCKLTRIRIRQGLAGP